jgi:hypothetical protein
MIGTAIDLSTTAPHRAVGKQKVTITQRFNDDGNLVDVECDGRFIFFFEKRDEDWRVRWKKAIYEKDKVLAVDPNRPPKLDYELLKSFPEGYRYLAYYQHKISGHNIKMDLPQGLGQERDDMYQAMKDWLEDKDINLGEVRNNGGN